MNGNGRRNSPMRVDRRRRGLSLLEVILALAVLAMAMTVLGQLIRIGARSASSAREVTRAKLLCESKLAEIAAGAVLPEPVREAALQEDPDWNYSIELEPTDRDGLVAVRVIVQRADASEGDAACSLVRWIIDPAAVEDATLRQEALDEARAERAESDAPRE